MTSFVYDLVVTVAMNQVRCLLSAQTFNEKKGHTMLQKKLANVKDYEKKKKYALVSAEEEEIPSALGTLRQF